MILPRVSVRTLIRTAITATTLALTDGRAATATPTNDIVEIAVPTGAFARYLPAHWLPACQKPKGEGAIRRFRAG